MENKFEQAKRILLHPNFKKLTPTQIQQLYKTILASGLTKADISKILKSKNVQSTYLEAMPYDLFLNFVLEGDIQGADLISLCNSSPLINEKCNKAFTAEGKVIPQYLFYILLQRMDLPKLTSNMDYRTLYKKVIENKPFFSVSRKLKILDQAEKYGDFSIMRYPNSIKNLLYGHYRNFGPFGDLNFRNVEAEADGPTILTDRYYFVSDLEDNLREFLDYIRDNYPLINFKFFSRDINVLTKEIGLTLEEFKRKIYGSYLKELKQNGVSISKKRAEKDFYEFINFNEIFRLFLVDWTNYFGDQLVDLISNIKDTWTDMVDDTIEIVQQASNEGIGEKEEALIFIEQLESISTLTDEEADYLVSLHEKVLAGKLPVLARFKFEELIKY
jgi:hypothetical protein